MAKADFSRHVYDTVMNAYPALALAFSSKVGLFDAMAKLKVPKPCKEIAEASGLRAGMLKDLLKCLVVAKVVDYDAKQDTFFLPAERLPSLQRVKGDLSYLKLLYNTFDTVEQSLQADKPIVPLSQAFWDESTIAFDEGSLAGNDELLVKSYVSKVPGLSDRLAKGLRACDIGCGKGSFTLHLARLYPASQFVGLDLSEEAIKVARSLNVDKLTNLSYVVGSAQDLPKDWSGTFDVLFANDIFHHLPDQKKAAQEARRVLKEGDASYFCQFEVNFGAKPEDHIGQAWTTYLYMFNVTFECTEGDHDHGDDHHHGDGDHHHGDGDHHHGDGDHHHGEGGQEEHEAHTIYQLKPAEGFDLVGQAKLDLAPTNILRVYKKK